MSSETTYGEFWLKEGDWDSSEGKASIEDTNDIEDTDDSSPSYSWIGVISISETVSTFSSSTSP